MSHVQSELSDGSVIQLYHKPSLLFLSLHAKHGVHLVEDEQDPNSKPCCRCITHTHARAHTHTHTHTAFVVYRDRGMGRVSITTKGETGKHNGYFSLTSTNEVLRCTGPVGLHTLTL